MHHGSPEAKGKRSRRVDQQPENATRPSEACPILSRGTCRISYTRNGPSCVLRQMHDGPFSFPDGPFSFPVLLLGPEHIALSGIAVACYAEPCRGPECRPPLFAEAAVEFGPRRLVATAKTELKHARLAFGETKYGRLHWSKREYRRPRPPPSTSLTPCKLIGHRRRISRGRQ